MVGTRSKDLVGQKFGRWTVLESAPHDGRVSRSALWKCVCSCNAETIKIVGAGQLRNGSSASCGCLRKEAAAKWQTSHRGSAHPNWKGGWVNVHGYKQIHVDGNPVLEHRKVMEQTIGRSLLPTEEVHHKNGNRTDNRIENLELWSHSQPAGQRVEDKVKWAKEILAFYEPAALRE